MAFPVRNSTIWIYSVENKAQCVREAVFHFAGRYAGQLTLTKTPMCISKQRTTQRTRLRSEAKIDHTAGGPLIPTVPLNNVLNQDSVV